MFATTTTANGDNFCLIHTWMWCSSIVQSSWHNLFWQIVRWHLFLELCISKIMVILIITRNKRSMFSWTDHTIRVIFAITINHIIVSFTITSASQRSLEALKKYRQPGCWQKALKAVNCQFCDFLYFYLLIGYKNIFKRFKQFFFQKQNKKDCEKTSM